MCVCMCVCLGSGDDSLDGWTPPLPQSCPHPRLHPLLPVVVVVPRRTPGVKGSGWDGWVCTYVYVYVYVNVNVYVYVYVYVYVIMFSHSCNFS